MLPPLPLVDPDGALPPAPEVRERIDPVPASCPVVPDVSPPLAPVTLSTSVALVPLVARIVG